MKETINAILKEKCFNDVIKPEFLLKEDLGLDSLNIVEVIVEIEYAFDIEVAESDLDPDNLKTVEQIYHMVEAYIGE